MQKKGREERDSIEIVTESEGTDDLLIVSEKSIECGGFDMALERSIECERSKGVAMEVEAQLGHRQLRDAIETCSEIVGCGVVAWMQSEDPVHRRLHGVA